MLDVANALLSIANTPIGTAVVQIGLLATLFWGGTGLFKAMKIGPSLATAFTTALTGIGVSGTTAAAGVGAISTAVGTLGSVISKAIPIVGAISIAISAATMIWDAFTVSDQELQESIDETATKLESLRSELEQLQSIDPSELTKSEEARLAVLRAQIEAQETLQQQNYQEQYDREFNDPFNDQYTILEQNIQKYNELGEEIAKVEERIRFLSEHEGDYSDQIARQGELLDDLKQEQAEYAESITDIYDRMEYFAEVLGITPDELREAMRKTEDWAQSTQEAADIAEDAADSASNLADGFSRLTGPFDASASSATAFAESIETLTDTFNTIEDDLSSLDEIQASYNSTGQITADQLTSLTNIMGAYNGAVQIVNGQLVVNKQALYDSAEQARQNAIQQVKLSAAEQLQQIAIYGVNEELNEQETAAGNAQSGLEPYLEWVNKVAAGTYNAATGAKLMNQSMNPGGSSASKVAQEILDAQAKVLQGAADNVAAIESLGISYGSLSPGSSSAASSTKTLTEKVKEQSDAFKELNEIMEHHIFLREKNGATEEELIQLNKEYQQQLHDQAEALRELGASEDSSYIRDLQEQWWGLQDTIDDLEEQITQRQRDAFDERLQISEDYMDERNELGDWGADNEIAALQRVLDWMDDWYSKGLIDYEYYWEQRVEIAKRKAEAEKQAWEDSMNAQIESLEDQRDLYETLFNVVANRAQDEIDKLEEQRTAIENKYQPQIDALQKVNDELEKQIDLEEALDALARARQTKVMVYKDGRFQYINDIDEVSEAQANLEKLQRDQVLQEELEKLEDIRDAEIASIDKQIEYWEKYKEEWSGVVDAYTEEQDRLMVEMKLGISLEGENWETRLDNLESYVAQYKSLMYELTKAQELLNAGYQGNLGTGEVGASGGSITPGSGSLAGTEYNAWAWVPGSGYVPVTVEGGHTVQTNLPEGTIIYGDNGAWKVTGGTGGDEGYTSEYVGETPSNIWTPGKGSGSSSSGSSGGSSGGSSSSSSKPSSSGSGGSYTGVSSSGGPSYNIGSQAGKDFINSAPSGSTINGADGSTWTKNPDGSTTINRGDNTWTVPAHASGTVGAEGGLSLVGENGPELRVLNQGDGVLPADVTRNLWDWSKYSPTSFLDKLLGSSSQVSVSIAHLSLPGIRDAQEFIEYFNSTMWRRTVQFQTS